MTTTNRAALATMSAVMGRIALRCRELDVDPREALQRGLAAAEAAGIAAEAGPDAVPADLRDLLDLALRVLATTGPLAHEGVDALAELVDDAGLASIASRTDLVARFDEDDVATPLHALVLVGQEAGLVMRWGDWYELAPGQERAPLDGPLGGTLRGFSGKKSHELWRMVVDKRRAAAA